DVSSLMAENRSLLDELAQCQADKDFVWSLWKKVQDNNPNISEAISTVLQREREKSEIKDRNILEILQSKDEKIEELQILLSSRSKEIQDVDSRHFAMQDGIQKLHKEVNLLRDKNYALEHQIKTAAEKESSAGDLQKKVEEELDRENQALKQRVHTFSKECDILKVEKADEVSKRLDLEGKVKILEQDVTEKISKFGGLITELEEAKHLLQDYEAQVQQQHKEVEFKNSELENVRKELSELWTSHSQLTDHSTQQAELIRQLQSLQQDTQKMLKNQEDAYTMENTSLQQLYSELATKYEQSKKSESGLRQQIHNVKKELLSKETKISSLQSKLDIAQSKADSSEGRYSGSFLTDKVENEPVVDLEFKIENQQKELDYLKNRIFEKDRLIEKLEIEKCDERQKDVSLEFDVGRLSTERTTSTPTKETRSIAVSPIKYASTKTRARSVSPRSTHHDLNRQLLSAERRLDDTKTTIKLKTLQLKDLKKAHERQTERLKTLQSSYKKAMEQIRTLEDELCGLVIISRVSIRNQHKKKKRRCDPKDLRKEDSDAVWNELSHFKSENRTLMVERLALEEDLDTFRVKTSQDQATIHELRVELEQEKEDHKLNKKKHDKSSQQKMDLDSKITLFRSEMQNKEIIIEKLEKNLRKIAGERDFLMDEKKNLKSELVSLKQSSAGHRIQTADMKREIQRLRRERDEAFETSKQSTVSFKTRKNAGKLGSRGNRRKVNGDIVKQYQKCLNTSIEKMKSVFDDFDDEGWEEIVETGEDEDTNTDTGSLGRAIASVSQTMVSDTGSSTTGVRLHKKKARYRSLNPHMSIHRKRNYHPALTRTSRRAVFSRDRPRDYTSTSSMDVGRQVVLREMGTSPMPSPERATSPQKTTKSRSQSPSLRQLKPLKQRLQSIQQQLIAIKESRTAAMNMLRAEKETNQQLQSDLNLANQRLQMNKRNIQKLSTDVEKLQKEKVEVEAKLTSCTLANPSAMEKHTEQDWKVLETRLKVSTNEITRQSAAARQLKMDNDASQEQIRNLNDRINSLERDTKQKRILLEEQRSKMRHVQESAKTDANILEELQTRIKLLTDGNEKNKTQVESLKKRLAAVTREKRDYEQRFLKLTADLEKKTKQLMDAHNRKMELESALSELEKTARHQLQDLANHSEAAIEAAQEKLIEAHGQIQQYQQFVKTFGHELLLRIQHTRSSIRDAQAQKEKILTPVNASLKRAQNLAKDILNLSQSDIDDIMSADGDNEEPDISLDKKQDKKWSKKCERCINEKVDFSVTLVELYMNKIEENNELLSKLYRS
ncbi:hypothetical protein ScPMuIL_018270, partial [Solemya velum]